MEPLDYYTCYCCGGEFSLVWINDGKQYCYDCMPSNGKKKHFHRDDDGSLYEVMDTPQRLECPCCKGDITTCDCELHGTGRDQDDWFCATHDGKEADPEFDEKKIK